MKKKFIIILLIMLTLFVLPMFFNRPYFNSIEWKNSWVQFKANEKKLDGVESYDYLSTRKKMAKYLIKNGTFIGSSKKDVERLVGLEDNNIESKEWQYWLSFTASDNEWLKVVFDESGHVVSVYKYED